MKKSVLLFFAALSAISVITSSCNKNDEDDGKERSKEDWYHTIIPNDPFYEHREGAVEPKFNNPKNEFLGSFFGYRFKVEWNQASYDTIRFEYELCWSEEPGAEYKDCHSFGRQKDNFYYVDMDKNNVEFDKRYYMTLNTYYWIGGIERRLQTTASFYIPSKQRLLNTKVLSDEESSKVLFDVFFRDPSFPSGIKYVSVTMCDVNSDNQIVNKYREELKYVQNDNDECVLESININPYWKSPQGWSGTIYVQFVTEDGDIPFDYFDIIDLTSN